MRVRCNKDTGQPPDLSPMNLTWHLVKKDVRQLRLAVALLAVLTLAKFVFYAFVGGRFGPPNLEWLNRLQSGPEVLLSVFAEPFIAYFLVGALVFQDSP